MSVQVQLPTNTLVPSKTTSNNNTKPAAASASASSTGKSSDTSSASGPSRKTPAAIGTAEQTQTPSVFTRRLLLHPRRRKLLPEAHPKIMLSEPAPVSLAVPPTSTTTQAQPQQRSREGLKLSFGRSFSEPFGRHGHAGALAGAATPPVLSPPTVSPALHPHKKSKRTRTSWTGPGLSGDVAPFPPTIREEQYSFQMSQKLSTAVPEVSSMVPSQALLLRPPPPGSVSLPASPCAESSTLERSLVLQKTHTLRPEQLAARLQQEASPPLVILDCRPFLAYNVCHVKGAWNINCCDRFHRRRLQQGRATLADLVSTREAKDMLRRRCWREVVVYDDCSDSLEDLPATHTLFLVLKALVEDHREPVLLKGGIRDFQVPYGSLCEDHLMSSSNSSIASSSPGSSPSFASSMSMSSSSMSSTSSLVSPLRLPEPPCSPLPSSNTKDIENHPATQVLPHLYLGNMRDASEAAMLKQQGIGYVLNVTAKPPSYTPDPGLVYKQLRAADNGVQNLSQFFDEAFAFIELAKSRGAGVLIHCHAGVSRSPTIAVAYLMKYYHPMAMAEAYSFVKTRRSIISPNLNFMGQLWEFEQGLRKEMEDKKQPHQAPSSASKDTKDKEPMEDDDEVEEEAPSSASSSTSSNSSVTCKTTPVAAASEPFRWRQEPTTPTVVDKVVSPKCSV